MASRNLAAMGEIALPRKVKPGGGEVWGRSPSFQNAQMRFFDKFDAPDLIAGPLSPGAVELRGGSRAEGA